MRGIILTSFLLFTVFSVLAGENPVASSVSVSVAKDGETRIFLSASATSGNRITYTLLSQPRFGALSGGLAEYLYIPTPGFTGEDPFTFKANNGIGDSNVATVFLNVETHTPLAQKITGKSYL